MHVATESAEQARAWLAPFSSHDTLHGMTAEAIALIRPLGDSSLRDARPFDA